MGRPPKQNCRKNKNVAPFKNKDLIDDNYASALYFRCSWAKISPWLEIYDR
jgi:hypothetical protein